MPIYQLRRFLRPARAGDGVSEVDETIEAGDEAEAITIAQALAAEPDNALLAVELRDETDRLVWSLKRGETVSRRPDGI